MVHTWDASQTPGASHAHRPAPLTSSLDSLCRPLHDGSEALGCRQLAVQVMGSLAARADGSVLIAMTRAHVWAPLVRLCAPVFAKAAGGAGRPPSKVELHAGPIFKKAARDGRWNCAHLVLAEQRQMKQDLKRLRVRRHDNELRDPAVERLGRCEEEKAAWLNGGTCV